MVSKKAGTSRSATTETAIVHVPGFVEDGKPEASRIVITPFAELLFVLKNRQRDEITSNVGTATWVEFPLEEVFADGLWAVIIALSKKYGLVFKTEHQVVNKIAPQVEYRINVGLTCSYANMQEAADAFEREVIAEVQKNFRKVSPRETHLPQSIWQLPAARFFARMTKTTQETAENIIREATNVLMVSTYSGYELTEENNSLHELVRIGGMLRWEEAQQDGPHVSQNKDLVAVSRALAGGLGKIKSVAEQIAIFRKLPYRLENIPAEVTLPQMPLSLCWVETQLLLAAGNSPDCEYLTEQQRIKALAIIRDYSHDDVIVENFLRRMGERGVTFEEKQLKYLGEYLRKRLSGLRSKIDDKGLYPGGGSERLFPYQFVRPRDPQRLEEVEKSITGPKSKRTRTDIARTLLSLDWKKMKQEKHDEFDYFVEEGFIPTVELARGIKKIRKSARAFYTSILLEGRRLDEKSFDILHSAGLIPADLEHAGKYWNVACKTWLRSVLAKELGLDSPHHGDLIMKILNRFDGSEIDEIISLPSERMKWVIFFSECLTMYTHLFLQQEKKSALVQVWEKLGSDLKKRIVFGAIVWTRRYHFYAGMEPDVVRIPPWRDLTESQDGVEQRLLAALGLTTTQLQKLVRSRKYSEENSLLWLLCGSESDRAEQLTAYKRDRAEYFRNHPVKRMSRGKGLAKKDSTRTVKKSTARKK